MLVRGNSLPKNCSHGILHGLVNKGKLMLCLVNMVFLLAKIIFKLP